MLLFGYSQQEAQGTSLAALIPPIGIFAALVYYQNNYVKIPVAAAVAAGFMIGAFFGALLVPRVPIEWLRLAFGGLLLYLGCSFVLFGFPPKGFSAAALPAGLAALLVMDRSVAARPACERDGKAASTRWADGISHLSPTRIERVWHLEIHLRADGRRRSLRC